MDLDFVSSFLIASKIVRTHSHPNPPLPKFHILGLKYVFHANFPLSSSGVENGNLRELALARMVEFGIDCRDVRTREVGIQEVHHKVRPYEVSTPLVFLEQ